MPSSLFLWGLLALLQIVFLPGHLLTRALRLRSGIVDGLLVTFGLSTLLNYLAIQFLVLFHVFNRPMVLAIIALELLALLLWRRDPPTSRWQLSAEAYRGPFTAWQKLNSPERSIVFCVALLAVFCTFALVHFATAAWQDEAFTLWDNVMSWNRWATEWGMNKFPWKTYHYPQLLPANSSIIYVLSGTTVVQAFNRFFFIFFPVAIFVCLFDLGLRRRQIGFWLGIPLIYFAWIFMARPFPAEGYADVPVTFMILMAVYSGLMADEHGEAGTKIRWMLTAGLFTGAALVTKQTGIVIILTLPVFLVFLSDSQNLLAKRQKRKAILWIFGLAILVSVPWYILKEVQIRTGVDQSEITGAVVAHGGRGFLARIQHGIEEMFGAWGMTQTVIVAVLAVAAAFLRNPWSWVVRVIVMPGFSIWAVTTSYDLRNSNFVVILGCASAGITLGHLLACASAVWRPWPLIWRNIAAAGLIVAIAFGLSFLPSVANVNLIARSDKAQKTTAMPELNAEIFRLIEAHKITRPVITNYWMMFFIPGLKEYMAYDSFTEIGPFKTAMTKLNPEYIVILHPGQNYPAVSEQAVSEHIADGSWSVAVVGGAFKILEVHRLDPPSPSPPPLPPPPPVKNTNFGVFKVLSGLAPEEGPYPQWNMPVVRWGLGPATTLEFDAGTNEPLELSFEIEHPIMKLSAEIVLNGAVITHLDIPADPIVKHFTCLLNVRSGPNTLDIRYSTWDAKSEKRPLAVLYRSIQIHPPDPLAPPTPPPPAPTAQPTPEPAALNPPSEQNPNFSVFKVLSGLAPEEGPYPQWNLPIVRWGLGPATTLEFDAKANETLELSFEIDHPITKLSAEIVLNGAVIAHLDIPPDPSGKRFRYPFNARSGTNSLDIRYSTWDTQSEKRPLAVLYRSIQIHSPDPLAPPPSNEPPPSPLSVSQHTPPAVAPNPPAADNPNFGVFKVLSGLAPEEGPYPQWNMPVVRWGLGPATILEFDSKSNEILELSFGIERFAVKLSLDIVLNHAPIAHLDVRPDAAVKNFKYALNTRAGTNTLEMHYSAWDAQSEGRPLAVLYRSIQTLPKK